MKVTLLVVDKNSHRYGRHAVSGVAPKGLPDVVMLLDKGKCAHYHFYLNPKTNLQEKIYCNNDVLSDKANGLLCGVHNALLFPTQKKPVEIGTVTGAEMVRHDLEARTPEDRVLIDPVRMRRITNKRGRRDWDDALDSLAIELLQKGYTAAAVRNMIDEDLGWELFDARTVYLLKHFIN